MYRFEIEARIRSMDSEAVVEDMTQDGTRIPAVEHHCEQYRQAPAGSPSFGPEQRRDLFGRVK